MMKKLFSTQKIINFSNFQCDFEAYKFCIHLGYDPIETTDLKKYVYEIDS